MANAPPGTQAMAFDIKSLHRTCPILPDHKPWLVVSFRGKFYIDHVHPFGACPASSNAGMICNAAIDIWQAELCFGNRLFKYEDDIQNFRFPNHDPAGHFQDGEFSYIHDRDSAMALISDLHIPWHPEKTGTHFMPVSTFIGFQWNLPLHCVSLPDEKRLKYLSRLTSMLSNHNNGLRFNLRRIQVLHGTLVHVSFVFPNGSSRLPVFSDFMTGLSSYLFLSHLCIL